MRAHDSGTCATIVCGCGTAAGARGLCFVRRKSMRSNASLAMKAISDTLVTLAVLCWQLACRAVSAFHLISRHMVWDGSRHILMCCLELDIKVGIGVYLESHVRMVL